MNRMTFIAPPKRPKTPKQSKVSKVEIPKSKPLSGHLYVAMGYVPGDHRFSGYNSAVISHRSGNQRANRRLSIAPIRYKTKESIIEALNRLIQYVEETES